VPTNGHGRISRWKELALSAPKILSTGSALPSNVGKSSLTKPAADRQITEASTSSASKSNSGKPATEGGASSTGTEISNAVLAE
jgi:hypothetical protein